MSCHREFLGFRAWGLGLIGHSKRFVGLGFKVLGLIGLTGFCWAFLRILFLFLFLFFFWGGGLLGFLFLGFLLGFLGLFWGFLGVLGFSWLSRVSWVWGPGFEHEGSTGHLLR